MSKDKIKNVVVPFLILAVLLLPLLFQEKGFYVLEINKLHNNFLDKLFIGFSALGNGITIALCAIYLLLKYRFKFLYEFAVAFIIQLGIVSLFKQVLFANALRPYKYFSTLNKEHLLNTVEGVHINLYDSFPSGHTATIFLIATFFALFYRNITLSFILFIIALFGGISRMYLVQHFYMDVYVGMLFGASSVFLAHYIVSRQNYSWFNKSLGLNFFSLENKSESTI